MPADASSADNESDFPWIVSVDDHVVEPAHVWQTWLPERYRADGPRIERRGIANLKYVGGIQYEFDWSDDGTPCDVWVYDGKAFPQKRHIAAVGYPRDEMGLDPITYDDMRPGCYEAKPRLADMDLNWVEASMSFPSFPRFCGQTFTEASDHDLGLACVKAYNDWMVEEWCGDSNGRLIPLCLIPLWDADLAAEEVRRNAARGVRAVAFSEIAPHLGLPSIHSGFWEPFFAACDETETRVCMHVGSSSKLPQTSKDAPPAVDASLAWCNSAISMTDFLMSGLFVRYPNLKVLYSEGQIGWIPYVLDRVDKVWLNHRAWAGVRHIPEPPSTYYVDHVYGCFFDDPIGLRLIDEIGLANAMFETDYPHTDSTWPDTKKIATELTTGLPADLIRRLMRGNAIDVLGLDLEP